MDVKLYIAECERSAADGNAVPACMMEGCRALCAASSDKTERQQLLSFLEKSSEASGGGKTVWGRTCFFLYDQTGKEHYRELIETGMKRLRDCSRTAEGIFACGENDSCQMPWNVMFEVYPFYMEYETRYHNKAEYADIVRQLMRLAPTEEKWTSEMGWYLMTVILVIDSMSREIFEHYKSLEEIFKKTIRKILSSGQESGLDQKESAMLGYSILKACSLGVLNSEKYAEIGLSMTDGIEGPFDLKDSECFGIAMMAHAERLNFK